MPARHAIFLINQGDALRLEFVADTIALCPILRLPRIFTLLDESFDLSICLSLPIPVAS